MNLRREFLSIADFVVKQNPKNMDDVMTARLKWVEGEPLLPGLIQLEDKLWQRILAKKAKVECPKLFASFGPNTQSNDLFDILSTLQQSTIIKPTHLLAGLGVIIVSPSGKIDYPTPSGPGSEEMKLWQDNHSNILNSENCHSKENVFDSVAELCIKMLYR